jgi:D-alanyl-D-alanine carboxypeptidase
MYLTQAAKLKRRAGFLAFLGLLAALVALPGGAAARYASIVIDASTGDVLHEINSDTRNYPASLTKMMTLYLAFEALDNGRIQRTQKLMVSRRAARMPASRLGLRRGRTISLEDAILALVTKSANDAAVVIAEALAGSESKFARLMTKKAAALGMTRTSFRNASGLHNRRQLSTARDIARLAQALIRDFPRYYIYFSTATFRYKGRTYRNHNELLKTYYGTDGVKTGYTRASGYNLAASTVRNGRRLIAVVFGGKTAKARDRHIAALLDKGFAMPVVVRGAPSNIPLAKPAAVMHAEAAPPDPPPAKPENLLVAEDTPRDRPVEPKHKRLQVTQGGPVSLLPPDMEPAASSAGSAEPAGSTGPVSGPGRAATRKRAAKAARNLAEKSIWGVQVGAFFSPTPAKEAAQDAAQRLPEVLGGTRVVIPQVQSERGRLYRARLMGLSETKARKACLRLRSLEIECLVVQASDPLELADNGMTTNTR